MKISKAHLKQMIDEEADALLGEKANPSGVNPGHFPLKLSDVDPAKAKVVSTTGVQDGRDDDDNIGVDRKPKGVAPVTGLSPSQSSMNIGNNIVLLFNNLNYIEYNINSIENEKAITYPASIKYSLQNKFPGIRLSKWDGIISKFNDIIILFLNDDYYIYDIGKNKIIIKTSMRKQWGGIWKININNL